MRDDFSKLNPQMHNKKSRLMMASQIIWLLKHAGIKNFSSLNVLDMGCSTGYIANILASNFHSVLGIDTDKYAINFAKKNFNKNNLKFIQVDASNTKLKDKSFNIIVCNQVYTCVEDPKKLMKEIYRLLGPNEIALISGANKFFPLRPAANWDINLKSYWELKKICGKFDIKPQTKNLLRYKYGIILPLPEVIWGLLEPLCPNFVWILVKHESTG